MLRCSRSLPLALVLVSKLSSFSPPIGQGFCKPRGDITAIVERKRPTYHRYFIAAESSSPHSLNLFEAASEEPQLFASSQMKRTGDSAWQDEKYCIIWVTVPSNTEGQKIAALLVREKAVACVNIIPGLTSVYEWEGNIEQSQESLLMIKTRKSLFETVKLIVLEAHPYDCPEIISTDVSNGSEDYLKWIHEETENARRTKT